MTMIPKTAQIIQLISPGVNRAVDRATHEIDPDRFHLRITGVCPFCLTIGEKLARAFRDNVPGSDLALQAKGRMIALMDAQDAADRPVRSGS